MTDSESLIKTHESYMLSSIYDNGMINILLYLEVNIYKNPTHFACWSVKNDN